MQEAIKKEKSVKVTEYVITEIFAGKTQLKDIWIDLLYSAYRRQQTNKVS